MPNCFQLIRNDQAVSFVEIDEEMCRHFGEPCDPRRYFRGWYDCIGYDLAAGRSFAEVRAIYADPAWADYDLLPVVEWLESNFSVRSWYEHSAGY